MVLIRGVVAGSVICFKYRDGVIIAADASAGYGNTFIPEVFRIFRLTENCLVGFSGKYSDIQFVYREVLSQIESEMREITPQGIHRLVQDLLYERRSRLDLLHVSAVVCGYGNQPGKGPFRMEDELGRFIGVVNSKGNFWFDDIAATGLGTHFILPILREKDLLAMGKDEAIDQIKECMRVLYYKSCQSASLIQIGTCEAGGVELKYPCEVETDWSLGIKTGEIVL